MFCTTCGQAIIPGQPACPRCGRPMTAPPPPPSMPGFEFELATYANKMRALSTVWFIYGALMAVFGFIGLAFANAFMHGHFNYWMHGPVPPMWLGPAIIHWAWMGTVVRAGLAIFAGWGLMERAAWGRIVAIIAAFANILHFPFGTALAIWSLVMLMGYRNATLYDQLAQ